jgi:hypothetical protein
MSEIPRLNGVIRALEEGKTAFVGFAPVDIETASALASSSYDGIAFEMEHAPMSAPALRDALQYMLDRRQILQSGTLAPRVTPMVRIPPNGGEMNQWIAKQVLDIGVFGIIFPHVSTVEEARNAIRAPAVTHACRNLLSMIHQESVAMLPCVQRGSGASRSRSTMPAPTCGPWRPRGKSWRSSSVKRCGPSKISLVSCKRCPALVWS